MGEEVRHPRDFAVRVEVDVEEIADDDIERFVVTVHADVDLCLENQTHDETDDGAHGGNRCEDYLESDTYTEKRIKPAQLGDEEAEPDEQYDAEDD